MRFVLAFSSFFRLLFGAKLHPKAANYLPEEALALPPATQEASSKQKPSTKEAASVKPMKEITATEKPKEKPKKKSGLTRAQSHRDGALAMLTLLQREGRLVDFLCEGIDDYDDADIGVAVRDIHRGCKKVLDDFLVIEAVMPGEEDDEVKVPVGFDPHEVRLIGEVDGDPPFNGVLRHHGWRVTKTDLPALSEGIDRRVLAPAEVEIGGQETGAQ